MLKADGKDTEAKAIELVDLMPFFWIMFAMHVLDVVIGISSYGYNLGDIISEKIFGKEREINEDRSGCTHG